MRIHSPNAETSIEEFLQLEARKYGRLESPAFVSDDEKFTKNLSAALSSLPDSIKKIASEKVLGIFFVNGLGHSAETIFVRDIAGKPSFGLIVMDAKMTERNANDWASWRENLAFSGQGNAPGNARGNATVFSEIAAPKDDTHVATLQYVFLHELGHVLGIGQIDLPPFDSVAELRPSNTFATISWRKEEMRIVSKFDRQVFPLRPSLQFYRSDKTKIPIEKAESVYRALAKTDLPTLYGSLNIFDDFAESFATYVHTVLMKKPWRIGVKKAGNEVFSLGSCWTDDRCRKKRKKLEAILKRSGEARSLAPKAPLEDSSQ